MRGYNIDEYINKKFNKLTLIKDLKKLDKNNSKLALFKCDCGNLKEIAFTQVLNNRVISCGCKTGVVSEEKSKQRKHKLLNFYCNKTMKNNTSGYTGITVDRGKYRVRITINRISINLGRFINIEDAIKARKQAEEKYFKELE